MWHLVLAPMGRTIGLVTSPFGFGRGDLGSMSRLCSFCASHLFDRDIEEWRHTKPQTTLKTSTGLVMPSM